MPKIVFTPSLFFQYSTCPHWIWHDLFGDPKDKGEVPALAEKLLEQGVLHEEEYVKDLDFVEVEDIKSKDAVRETLKLMREGADLIYQGEIEFQLGDIVYRGRPDLLEKHSGKSSFGDYYYIPVDIKSSSSLKKEQRMQLMFYGKILEKIQGVFPEKAAIINRDHERIQINSETKYIVETEQKIEEIADVMLGNKPPLKLVSTCKNSPWFQQCVKEAEKVNDIALIYKLDARSHPKMRKLGIETLQDAAKMNIDSLPKIPYASPERLNRTKLQAEALLSDELRWLALPEVPQAPLKLFFDIEGDPLLQLEYMFGFWVSGDPEMQFAKIGHIRQHGDKYFVYFLAEQPEDEQQMWSDFLAWLELLPSSGYKVYHYADYERSHTLNLAQKYGGSSAFTEFTTHYVDLLKIVLNSVIFPLYFYSIKDIAKSKFLNFKWSHAKAGGAQSIFWYEEWLETGDEKILNDIINYNEDDVRATEHLYEWLLSKANSNE